MTFLCLARAACCLEGHEEQEVAHADPLPQGITWAFHKTHWTVLHSTWIFILFFFFFRIGSHQSDKSPEVKTACYFLSP